MVADLEILGAGGGRSYSGALSPTGHSPPEGEGLRPQHSWLGRSHLTWKGRRSVHIHDGL